VRSFHVCLLALIVSALPAAAANADFTPVTLVSGTQLIPFEQATSPALSGDGRYVVFQGTLAGVSGIYRRDLQTGEVVPVAVASKDPAVNAPDATAPSVSANGRYVAFTSAAVLDPAQDTASGCPQVYVRDMDEPLGVAGAYTLASALNGTSAGLTYAAHCPAVPPTQLSVGGAQAAAGVALSADGRRVVFTVLSPSDLSGPCTTTPTVECPAEPSQVALRDLASQTTTLVTATPQGQPTQGGGAFPSAESEQKGVRPTETTSEEPVGSSAAISADGSTVAWLGTNVALQVSSATDVITGMLSLGRPVATEVEPLWRRVADGSAAVTRRLLNEARLNFYSGQVPQETPEAVEGGTFYPASQDFVPPVLSADGTTVAAVANAPSATNEGSIKYSNGAIQLPSEAYVVEVNDDPASSPRVTALTATPNFAASNAIAGGVSDITISPDGSRVVFNTRRTSFALAPPTLISPPAPEGGDAYTYEANIALGTLQRVTSTYDGSPPSGGNPGLLSFAGDGASLAFASSADNLFYGDPTPNASQVYLVHEIPTAGQVAPQGASVAPITPLPIPVWVLSATATAQVDGSVLVDAQVPGVGRLGVRATTQLQVFAGRSARLVRHAGVRPATRAFAARSKRKTKTSAGATIPTHTVALAGTVAGGPSEVRLRVRATARYRALVDGRNGLYALLRVTFTARAHQTLVQAIPVTFRVRAHKRTKR
jgi:hypothetical protein